MVPLLQDLWPLVVIGGHWWSLLSPAPASYMQRLRALRSVVAESASVPALVSLRKAVRASTQAGGEAGPVPAQASIRLLGARHLDFFGPGGWKHVA